MRIDWVAAREAHGGGGCSGLTGDCKVVDDNDPETELLCHESEHPVSEWCSECIGWVAVCELAFLQQTKKLCAGS